MIDLYDNQVTDTPQDIGRLVNLTSLNLYGNELVVIPSTSRSLTNLTSLDLSNNKLEHLPKSVASLKKLHTCNFKLYKNPLTSPPMEIAKKGIKAIEEYF